MIPRFVRAVAARHLMASFARMPGLPAKAAQVMSQTLGTDLGNSPQPLPLERIKAIIAAAAPLLNVDLVELDAVAHTASLGQVHRGRLRCGTLVAIKVQYPKIGAALEQQVDTLFKRLARFGPQRKFDFDGPAYRSYFLQQATQELDYIAEAKQQARFHDMWADDADVVIPKVLLHYCTPVVLVQRFEPAMGLRAVTTLAVNERQHCGDLLAKVFLKSLFGTGLVHADFHPGNWGYRPSVGPQAGQLVVYDFGSLLEVSSQVSENLQKLTKLSDSSKLLSELGFDPAKLARLEPRLNGVLAIILEPLRSTGGWRASQWDAGPRLRAALGDEAWWFRTSGPPWFLLLMRAANAVTSALQQLDCEIVPMDVLGPLFASARFKKGSDLPEAIAAAEFLVVRVQDGDEELVSVQLPSHTIDCLEELIPEEVRAQVVRLGHDLMAIKLRARATNLVPQLLFEATIGARSYCVRLA